MKHISNILILSITSLLLGVIQLQAIGEKEQAIKERMVERLPAIDALKLVGKVGENNLGFLTQRDQMTPAESTLMREENTDRRELYTILAKRLGLTVKVVGQGRAESLREKSAKGVWLQDPEGNWYQQE